ncbi:MAG TPA: zinc-dependent metalloprotease [Candidatus Limnocylindria bacterium]|nr:zinc-dependent metalloprotease [Candidatus Limnocylindria bacterium]
MTRNPGRLGAGILVGGLLAMGASVAQREIMRRAGTRLIDWRAVRAIALRRLGPDGGPMPAESRAAAEAFYRDVLLRIEPVVADEIGAELPAALETPVVVDRAGWVELNLATFQTLFERVERIVAAQQTGEDTAGRALARLVNRSIGNQQLGFLLAFLARKVLGQYDVSLLAAGPTARGRLHFVEPNIAATASAMRLPHDEFRTFIALHEATHAFEFEAYPWLRDHFAALVAESIEQLAADSSGMVKRLQQALARRGTGHWLERLMTPAQLETFQRTQAMMSLLEGYSNHVMNAAGARLLPGFAEIHERFERRNEGRSAIERAIMRITGLDLKMEQYEAGERFVTAVIAARGRAFLNQVWQGPDRLPTLTEIRQPADWIARMEHGPRLGAVS